MADPDLPDLRILPTEALVLHEETEPERTGRLVASLQRDGTLRNPPIVAALPDSDRFVVLDGANRTTSLRAMGVPHILAQVVDYNAVALDTWNHVVTGMSAETLFATIRQVPGLTLEGGTLAQGRGLLLARRCLGYLVCEDGDVFLLRGGQSLQDEAQQLREVVRAYKGIGRLFRVRGDAIAEQRTLYDQIAALIVFPPFTPADIMALAMTDDKLPTGITRHIIPGRALRVNYDLGTLADATRSVAEKNEALQAFIRERLQARAIRYYEESTVLFDE